MTICWESIWKNNVMKQVIRCCVFAAVIFSLVGCQHTTPQQTKKQTRKPVPTRTNNITAVNPKAYHQAYENYLHRAEEGDAVAAFNLGRMYADGRGVAVDDHQAFEWFQKAARKGLPDAKLSLGVAYLFAKGTEQNPRQACKIFKQAMRKGDQSGKEFYKHYC